MSVLEQQVYAPVLRMKKGEYDGLAALHPSVAMRILPHLIVPPPEEPDKELGRQLSESEIVSYAAARIGRFWQGKPAIVDVRFLLPRITETEPTIWLPRLFRAVVESFGVPIPIASLRDLEGGYADGFINAIKESTRELALRVTLSNLGDEKLASRIQRALLKVGLKPQQCILVLDFSDADFSDKDIIADQYQIYFDELFEIGLWNRIVFQGTSFPDQNPAPAGGQKVIDRNDWLAWKIAAEANSLFKQQAMFGDFGADNACFRFGASKAKAIRHYRYSTSDHWHVVRAPSLGTDRMLMREVSKAIVEGDWFAGRDFSLADKFIDDCAAGWAGPGNSTTWREINTCHHLTQVIHDLSAIHSFAFQRREFGLRPTQVSLL